MLKGFASGITFNWPANWLVTTWMIYMMTESLEVIIPHETWPLATYREMLFIK